MAEKDDLASF